MYITLLSFRMVTLFFSLPEYVYIYTYVATVALEQQDCRMLLLVLCCCYSFFLFYVRIYVIKRAGLVMVLGKKEKNLFLFFFFLALFRSYLIDAIFDDDVLSLFSFSCRWDSICSLKAHITNCDSTKTERTRQDNCVHYWNKWSCYTTSEQNDGRERRRRRDE